MPRLPSKEADILALAKQMVAGYQSHGADFPSIIWPLLHVKFLVYANARKGQIEAHSQLQLATDNKNASLDTLRELMKNCLKKSQVDVTGDPDKLEYIGWGPKAPPASVEPPGQPRNLEALTQGRGTILFGFDRPATGGTVRNYIIERREQSVGNAEFGPWHIAGTALETEASPTGQPRGVQLEYRVKAVNTSGQSAPSNTAAVVL